MKLFMYVCVAIIALAIVGFVFQTQIVATALYLSINQQIDQTDQTTTKLPQVHELDTTDRQLTDIITAKNLQLPILFTPTTNQKNQFGGSWRSPQKSLLVYDNDASWLDTLPNQLDESQTTYCQTLQTVSNVAACDSSYNYLKAVAFTSPTSVTWHASTKEKIAYYTLMNIKVSMFDGRTPDTFVIDIGQGFITYDATAKEAQIQLFLDNDDWYTITAFGYSLDEINYTLKNTVLVLE